MRSFVREKRTICADRYMEVDIYPISERERHAGRAAKENPSRTAQANLNERTAHRQRIWKANHNFTERDFHLSLTYKNKFLPKSEAEARRNLANYMRRVNRELARRGEERAKVYGVTAHSEPKSARGAVRWHHHVMIHAGSLTRDELEALWQAGRGAEREPIGYANADRLQFEHNSLERLVKYFEQQPNRCWTQSNNLLAPRQPRPNDGKYTRAGLARICKSTAHLPDFWAAKYPGWRLIDADPQLNDFTGWHLTLRFEQTRPAPKRRE